MTQERKRAYKRRQADNLSAAATEMGNVPPQATDVEEAVLGAMMVNPDSVDTALDILNPKCFYDLRHRMIFEAIQELYTERTPIDMLTLVERLKQKGTLADVGGPARLVTMTQAVATGANVDYYVRILQQKGNIFPCQRISLSGTGRSLHYLQFTCHRPQIILKSQYSHTASSSERLNGIDVSYI